MSHSVDVRAFRDICTKVFRYLPSLGKLFRRFTEKVAGLATFLAVLANLLARPAIFQECRPDFIRKSGRFPGYSRRIFVRHKCPFRPNAAKLGAILGGSPRTSRIFALSLRLEKVGAYMSGWLSDK